MVLTRSRKRGLPTARRSFPIEIDIYQCGGVRVDGMWFAPHEVEKCAQDFAIISNELNKPFVFKKQEDTAHSTALRVSTTFQKQLDALRKRGES